jgi:LysM repeat protein
MLKTQTLPVILLIVALFVPITLSGQVSYEVSDQKVVLDGQTYYIHLVLKDQTLYSLALTYKVSIDAITSNNAIPSNGILEDQILRIPESADMAATMPKPKPSTTVAEVRDQPKSQPEKEMPPPASATSAKEDKPAGPAAKVDSEGYRMHKVKKGETLYSLSRDYKVTVEAIIRTNDVPRNEIQIGQTLRIPPSDYVTFVKEEPTAGEAPEKEAGTPPETKTTVTQQEQPSAQSQAATPQSGKQKAKPAPKTYHKVKKGESLSDIAEKYNVTVREIKDANEGLIFPMAGMKLLIPVKNSEAAGPEIKD